MGVFKFFAKKKYETQPQQDEVKMEQPQPERVKHGAYDLEYDNIPAYILNSYTQNSRGGLKYNSDTFLLMYERVPQLQGIINYILDKAAEVPFRHYRYQGNGKKKDLGETDVIKLLQNPNERDNEISFKQDAIAQLAIHGNVPIIKKRTPGFALPTKLWVEASNRIWAIPKFSIDQYGLPNTAKDHTENPIVQYRKQLDSGELKTIDIRDMIYIRDVNPSKTGRDFYYGQSRIYAATKTIKVLDNLYNTLNALLANRGALGFIKRNTRQGEVDAGMWNDAVEKFEAEFLAKYGTSDGKRPVMATVADLDFIRMSFPISEFMPTELGAQEFSMLCNSLYGFPDKLLNSKDASTYNNITTLERMMYTNTLMPILATLYNGLSAGLGLTQKNEWLEADYSGIECLQASAKEKADMINVKTGYLTLLNEKGYINKNKVLEEIGYETVANDEFNQLKVTDNGKDDGTPQGE
jgi:phage portal protein BeeE